MKYLKKYWLIILLIVITIIRFLMTYNLPSYYLKNLGLDDNLMIELANNIFNKNYLGNYSNITLVKGFIFPIFLTLSRILSISYSSILTILYIIACIFFTNSIKEIIKNKKILVLMYIVLLFNPISYSIELFQRLYRNSLSLIQILFFFSFIIRIIKNNNIKKNILNYIFLGITTGIMYLTREDNIWCMIILIFLFFYKFIKNKNYKSFLVNLIPIITLYLILNIASFINYKYYGIYTYNELANSSFKDCYIKIQEIKDDKKINKVSITKDSLHKLADVSKYFDISHEEIDDLYNKLKDLETGEINNGNIIWYFRHLIYSNKRFKTGREANIYFKNLSNEIDELFKSKKLEKEFAIKSVFINTPSLNDLKLLPSDLIEIIKYSSSYQNVKTMSQDELNKLPNIFYDNDNKTYYTFYRDYHNAENIVENNIKSFEIIRIIYKYFTIIFSIISIIIYLLNIKKLFKEKEFFTTIILISYLIILLGVTYTNTTGFYAIRYYYLGNIYILQNIFIILNLEGVNYERFRINNINALFKRRKNNR